jgi:hypothetical protein
VQSGKNPKKDPSLPLRNRWVGRVALLFLLIDADTENPFDPIIAVRLESDGKIGLNRERNPGEGIQKAIEVLRRIYFRHGVDLVDSEQGIACIDIDRFQFDMKKVLFRSGDEFFFVPPVSEDFDDSSVFASERFETVVDRLETVPYAHIRGSGFGIVSVDTLVAFNRRNHEKKDKQEKSDEIEKNPHQYSDESNLFQAHSSTSLPVSILPSLTETKRHQPFFNG